MIIVILRQTTYIFYLDTGVGSHHGKEADMGEDECEAGAEEGPAARESAHLCSA